MRNRSPAVPARLLLLLLVIGGCDALKGPAEHIARGEEDLQSDKLNSASIEFKKVLQKEPDNWRARLLLAKTDLALGDVTAALADFAKVGSTHSAEKEYASTRWRLAMVQGRFAEVVSGLSAQSSGLGEPERLLLLAQTEFVAGRAAQAEALLRQGLQADPSNEDLTVLLGATLAWTRDAASAVDFLAKARAAVPKSFRILRAYADALLRSGDFKGAEREFRAASALVAAKEDLAGYLSVTAGLTESLLALQRAPEAAKLVEQMSQLAPNARLTFMARAQVAEAMKDYGAALDNLQQVLNSHPDDVKIRMMIASVNLERGNPEQATYHLQNILSASPGYVGARRMLAQIYLSQGRAADAAKLLDEGSEVELSPDLQLLQARAALDTGDKAKALGLLAAVESAAGSDARLRQDLAAAYLQAGKPDNAVNLLEATPGAASPRADQLRLMALVARNRDEGIEALLGYAKANQEHLPELRFAATALLGLGRASDAEALLSKFAEAHPRDAAGLGALAEVQARAGRLDDAATSLKRSIAVQPSNEARIGIAKLALARGQDEEAIRWLEQARAADAKATAPRALLVRAYLSHKQLEKAQAIADELVSLDPAHPEPHILAADVAVARNDLPRATRSLEEAVRVGPASSAAWQAKGQLHERLKQTADALSAYRKATQLAPAALAPLVGIVRLEAAAGNMAGAMAAARLAQARQDSRPAGLTLEGQLLLQNGKAAEAAQVFQTLQTTAPSSGGIILLYRARLQAGLKSPEAALVDWLRDRPSDNSVRVTLAEHWAKVGSKAQAVSEYETAVKFAPNSAELANNLAWAYNEAGDPRALATAQRAYDLAPGNVAIADTLGWVLTGQGRAEGLKFLRIAAAGAPRSADIQFHLAKALVAGGEIAEARKVAEPFTGADATPDWRQQFLALFPH